jgi:hypothetical protein
VDARTEVIFRKKLPFSKAFLATRQLPFSLQTSGKEKIYIPLGHF